MNMATTPARMPALRTEAERNALAVQWGGLPRRVLGDLLRRPSLRRRIRALGLDDLEQVGQMGLLRAAALYDPARGYKFVTYAYAAIRRKMLTAIFKEARWLDHRVPNGPRPVGRPTPGDAPNPPDRQRPRPDGALDLAAGLARLTPRDRAIITGYYGLTGDAPLSTVQMGERFGIGSSRAGQLLNRAQIRVAIYCLAGK